MMSAIKKAGMITALLALGSFTAQCGLERSITAWSAPDFVETIGTTYKFRAKSDHLDDTIITYRLFLGYEIYYKIGINESDFNINLTDYSQLEGAGFRKMHSSADKWSGGTVTSPLLVTGGALEGTEYDITIDFTNAVLPLATSANFSNYELRRDPQDTTIDDYGYFKRFSEFYTGDTDIPASYIESLPAPPPPTAVNVYIAIYVFAYGKSINPQTIWQDIRSPLRYLFYNTITVYYDNGVP